MDAVHDLGGKPGFGPVDKDGDDDVFHERWEAKVFAMTRAGARAGAWLNVDRFRHAVERIDPRAYLEHGYYGRWLGGIETLLVEAGVVSQEEISERALALGAGDNDLIAAKPSPNPDPLGPGSSAPGCYREIGISPLFDVGEEIVTAINPKNGHTRLPSYARGKVGLIEAYHGGWIYPDTNAHGLGEQPQHLYTVRFSSETLWDKQGFSVRLDLFEPYLRRSIS